MSALVLTVLYISCNQLWAITVLSICVSAGASLVNYLRSQTYSVILYTTHNYTHTRIINLRIYDPGKFFSKQEYTDQSFYLYLFDL